MQFADESQGQSTGRPEKVRTVDWIPLLCIQTWCLWWYVDGTSVACLFDCYVSVICMYCVMFDLRRTSPNSPKRPNRDSSVT